MKSDLREAAAQARLRAYAPYSGFLVGAALRLTSGAVVSGCNVENISFGLTMCAERVCAGKAIEQGEKGFEALAIVADTETPIVPCGACRQVLAEFAPALVITSWTLDGKSQEFSLADLLPLAKQGILQVPRGT
ncbi:MAG: cytidine deaminase [Verrucomicrobia bacterium]|nr:MAG: cytidine deaminase [Verrucomicrobiota bacterium]